MSYSRIVVDCLNVAHVLDRNGVSACGRPSSAFDVRVFHPPWRTCPGCNLVLSIAHNLSVSAPPVEHPSPEELA